MFYKEHVPPHFHAKYAGQWASFSIEELKMIEGAPGAQFHWFWNGHSSIEMNSWLIGKGAKGRSP
jgi:hypothetical protein